GTLGGQALRGGGRPATGSVVAHVRGHRSPLPPFLVVGGRLHQGKRAIIGEGGGPLGARYDPFRLEYDPERQATRIPALQLPPNLTPDRLGDRQRLLGALDNAQRQTDLAHAGRAIDDHRAQALALLTAPDARRAFDLTQERPELAE